MPEPEGLPFGIDSDSENDDREVIAGSTHPGGVRYTGFVPPEDGWKIERVPVARLDAKQFFEKYVKTRTPVVLQGDLPDPEWKGKQWTVDYLKKKAGAARVKVEPVGPEGSFGTATKRITMTFGEFLTRCVDKKEENLYLTTQYDDEEEDGEAGGAGAKRKGKDDKSSAPHDVRLTDPFPEPTTHLLGDFPEVPRILGNLFLSQVNLWVGRSPKGSSSGLHHDYHDNLYVLLQGKKRFNLFAPSEAPNMYTYGDLHCVHPNGVICYRGARTRADGLSHSDVAQYLMEKAEGRVDELEGSGGAGAEERRRLEASIDRWLHDVAWADREADEDARAARRAAKARAAAEAGGEGGAGGPKAPPEPRSFSKVPVKALRAFEKGGAAAAKAAGFPKLGKARRVSVELGPGDMLYLPASWFHEVTSASVGDDAPHVAWNYWLHPPDGAGFECPYGEGAALLRDKAERIRRLAAEAAKGSKKAGGPAAGSTPAPKRQKASS